MHQLLLVDDEEATLQGLASLSWSEAGIDQVHCAYSAKEAMVVLSNHLIDVVVTDIRMPGKSGTELLIDIERSGYRPKCLLLSGHSDFAYAKAAIKAQAVDYLLKPVRDEELLDAVKKALHLKQQEEHERYIHEKSIEAVRSHIDFFGESIIKPWLNGKKNSEELKAELKAYGIPYSLEVRAVWLHVRLNECGKVSGTTLEKAVNDYLAGYAVVVKQQIKELEWAFLLYPVDEKEVSSFCAQMLEQTFLLKQQIKKLLRLSISIKMGDCFFFWEEARSSYDDLREQVFVHDDTDLEQLAGRVREFVEAHFNDQPNLQDVARYLYLNPAYVSKRFKEETGENFTDYTQRMKMNRAVALLAETNMKISRIAKELGYKDSSYFIKVFKREFKQTPQEFRSR